MKRQRFRDFFFCLVMPIVQWWHDIKYEFDLMKEEEKD